MHISKLLGPTLVLGLVVPTLAQDLRLNGPEITRSTTAAADSSKANEEFFAVGTLQRVRRTDTGSVRIGLVGANQEILAFIAPTTRLPVNDYLGQEVGISARTFSQRDDVATYVLVDEIVPVSGAASATASSSLARVAELPQLLPTPTAPTGSGVQQATAVAPAIGPTWSAPENSVVAPATGHVASACNDPGCASCGGGYVAPATYGGVCPSCTDIGCTSCTTSSCGGCGGCDSCCGGPPGWLWVRGEYLLWWGDGMQTPPLITSSPEGTPAGDAGVLGLADTSIVYGNQDILEDSRSGFRIQFGGWFDACRKFGWEVAYFDLGDVDERFEVSGDSNGMPIYARPFLNLNLGIEDSQLISYPGLITGDASVASYSQLNGAAGRLRWNLCCKQGCRPTGYCGVPCGYPPYARVDFSLGYRYLGLDEGLTIHEDLVSLQANNAGRFLITDVFETSNDFHGGEIATLWECGWNRWTLELASRLGIGGTRQKVAINGFAENQPLNAPTVVSEGGLLATESNIGLYSQDRLAVVPELTATLGFYLTPRFRVLVGYDFIYWSNVVRPGDQISLVLNTDQIAPAIEPSLAAPRPVHTFHTTDFWAQGLHVALDLHW